MSTNITSKGQVTVPKTVRDALGLKSGSAVDFSVSDSGQVVLSKAGSGGNKAAQPDRFEAARGKAQVRWRTKDLMALPAWRRRMILVDTNVLVDVWGDDQEWADWSITQLRAQSQLYPLRINPVIYAELSLTFKAFEDLDQALDDLGLLMVEMPRPALFLAGKAFIRYRRRGGKRASILSDFFIGAHAAVTKSPILTRDPGHYGSYFPTVKRQPPALPSGKAFKK